MGANDTQQLIDIEDGWEFWHHYRGRVILPWKEGDRAKLGVGVFPGGAWLMEGKAHRHGEGDVQPTPSVPLPDKPDHYDDWEYWTDGLRILVHDSHKKDA